LEDMALPTETLLNVNVPDLPWAELKGIRATRLGARHRAEHTMKTCDPRSRPVYWIGRPGGAADNSPGTDFAAVAEGAVSVTPLSVDLTRQDAVDALAGSLGGWS